MSDGGRSPMRPVIVVLALALASAVAFVAWSYFGGEEPAEVTLSGSSPSPSSPSGSPSDEPAVSEGFEGKWTVDTQSGSLDDGTSTFAGYRIEEELGGIGAKTAVGRTQDVTGTLTVDGTSVSSLELTVDMTTLRSDQARRDGQLSTRGLETDLFPAATFVLTGPVDLGAEPEVGTPLETSITGDLTLHGVTREISVPIAMLWTGERMEVAASFDVTLTDYDIEAPVGFMVLSIADTGTVEMHVLFQKA